ncbi:MAG: CDP-diacylglycerol--glycerol-3-phosphate 3-phosphatidyltransferase [Alphaproteobacteria bacterium]|nr:CDP-diacylglycerol--glycerol-3-phosphate 3-phosphatidyltransferase [Alphaproteobacteria bacterium]
MNNLPNVLTMSRIIIIPIVIATFYIDNAFTRWLACGLFITAGVTDYLDGYLARKMEVVSKLGRFLDPIADKLLVASLLLMLGASGRLGEYDNLLSGVLPALVILCRELLVSGLREFLAEIHISVPVTKLAKWKTTFQLVALPMLIVGKLSENAIDWQTIGTVFLWLAAILTIITGYDYLKAGLKHMNDDA